MAVIVTVLSVLLAALFGAAGVSKVAGAAGMMRDADRFGFSHAAYRGIGLLEIAGGLGLLAGLAVTWLGAAAGIGLALLMAGAAVVHLRHDPPAKAIPAAILAPLSLAVVVMGVAAS